MNRQTLLAVVLCFLIFFGWQKFYVEPHMAVSRQQTTAATTQPPAATAAQPAPNANGGTSLSQATAMPVAPQSARLRETAEISNGTGTALTGDGGKAFVGWDLKSYRLGLAPKAAAVDLQSVTNQAGQMEFAFESKELAYLSEVQGKLQKTPEGAIWTYEDANVRLTREFSTPPGGDLSPWVNATLTAEFKTKQPKYAFVSLTSESPTGDPQERDRQFAYFTNRSMESETVRSATKDLEAVKGIATPVHWIAAENRYFLFSLVEQGLEPIGQIQPVGPGLGRISMVYPVTEKRIRIPLKVYFGPKELDVLRAVDPTLGNAVDFGWFTIIAYPILRLMKWLYGIPFVHNYGVAIILLTLLLKIVTYPLTLKQMKSMKEMARIQPQIAKIREKHKDDKEALNREMLSLMRTHGYNPMAGCLPLLIQMPVFFALYRVLYGSIELYQAPFVFWIHDLSLKDPIYFTPILLAGAMYLGQKLTPSTATDPAQQKMLQFMPLIFGVFMLTLPSGLTIYMLTNSIASIAQQIFLNKKLGITPAPAKAAT